MEYIITENITETPKTRNWLPRQYVSRKEYLRLYQKNRYHSDELFRQTQMLKVKERYRLKKLVQNNIKDNSIQVV
jgi:hypothetical protein